MCVVGNLDAMMDVNNGGGEIIRKITNQIIWWSGIHVVFNASENSKTERGGLNFVDDLLSDFIGVLSNNMKLNISENVK